MGLNQTIKTPDLMRYFDLGRESTPDMQFAGVGFNDMGENPNAQVTTQQYISERSSTSDVETYQPSWSIDADMLKTERTIMRLWEIGSRRKTGADAQFYLVIAELFNPVEGEANTYVARKQLVSAEITGMTGDPGSTLHITGNLNAVGDQVLGVFDTTAKTFTPDSELVTP